MKTMRSIKLLAAVLIAPAAAAPALSAQEGEPFKPYLGFGFALAHGHAHDMTQKTWGGLGAYSAEFGLEFSLPQTNIRLRPNFGVTRILGGSPDKGDPRYDPGGMGSQAGKIYDLMGIYVGVDFVYSPFVLPITITTGPSFHTWNVDEVDAFGDPNQGSKEMKLGWRLGVGYQINGQFRVGLAYALTEWRTLNSAEQTSQFIPGFNPSRPAYFTLSASYSF